MWEEVDNSLVKEFRFADFPEVMEFMMQAASRIDALNHHPTWENTYNRLRVTLTTHDAGKVTDLDWRLAEILDALFETYHPRALEEAGKA